ncbi:hypothetical protein ACN24K_29940 [Streptomyces microflavus]
MAGLARAWGRVRQKEQLIRRGRVSAPRLERLQLDAQGGDAVRATARRHRHDERVLVEPECLAGIRPLWCEGVHKGSAEPHRCGRGRWDRMCFGKVRDHHLQRVVHDRVGVGPAELGEEPVRDQHVRNVEDMAAEAGHGQELVAHHQVGVGTLIQESPDAPTRRLAYVVGVVETEVDGLDAAGAVVVRSAPGRSQPDLYPGAHLAHRGHDPQVSGSVAVAMTA